jgi:ribosome-binding factor A
MKHHRLARVAEAIREAASEAILFQLKDPRVKFTTVTRAEVSADLQHARVYVSVMGSDRDRSLTLHGLKSATGFIQSKVGDRMKSRYVPHLEFVLDEGVRNSQEVARLLAEEKARDQESGDRGQESDEAAAADDPDPETRAPTPEVRTDS